MDRRSLRSARTFAGSGVRSFSSRTRMHQTGKLKEEFVGRPVIAIINTWSDLNPCHSHFKITAESIKRGVVAVGGFPVELPVMSMGEPMVKPSTMLYRNLLAMEVEETLRSNPVDGAVLMGGCDKTGPALIMGALSMNLPCIFVPAGPMLTGRWRGESIGSGTSMFRYYDEFRAGKISEADWESVETSLARSVGHCMTMGTASTMTALIEVLGFSLPGSSSTPAADSRHQVAAVASGRRIVDLVDEELRPRDVMTKAAVQNACRVLMSLGGSTNAVIHLVAMARRAGIALTLQEIDEIAGEVPVLANLMPTGKFLMEDFFYAGGLPALLKELSPALDLSCPTVTGGTLGENIAGAEVWDANVIRGLDDPVAERTLAVLYGNLAPDGCVLKVSAASPKFLSHRGPALVFDGIHDLYDRIDREDLDVDEDTVLILRNVGPVGAPGMPEWGMIPIPKKLLAQGVRDMVRISDCRMSGTSFGTCILHVAPESAVGGPLSLVQSGDQVRIDVDQRLIEVDLPKEELERRAAALREGGVGPRKFERGYYGLYCAHVLQADAGCDFDFLVRDGHIPEPDIF